MAMRTRFDIMHYTNRKDIRPVVITYSDVTSLLNGLTITLKKFKQVKKQENAVFYINGTEHEEWDVSRPFADGTNVVIGDTTASEKPLFTAKQLFQPAPVDFLHNAAYVDKEAKRQLFHAAQLPGMVSCVGMPDLHVGSGAFPVGAAFISSHIIPELVGSDIGCGMSLFPLPFLKPERLSDKVLSRISTTVGKYGFPGGIDSIPEIPEIPESDTTHHPRALAHADRFGTIGGGNHFAELQVIDKLVEPNALSLEVAYLLVHSGSRTLGKAVAKQYNADKDIQAYREGHRLSVKWASENRAAIARRFSALCGGSDDDEIFPIIDITHNSVSTYRVENEDDNESDRNLFLHRKGAAPMEAGLVAIPGSRGTFTYIVRPTTDPNVVSKCASSIAHGAGRAMSRTSVSNMLHKRYNRSDAVSALSRTKFNGYVVYDHDRVETLFEEAPEAYKSIETVIDDLVSVGAVTIVAIMKPLVTCKL